MNERFIYIPLIVLISCTPEGFETNTTSISSTNVALTGFFEELPVSPTSGAEPFCGDGFINPNEECDEGALTCFDYYCENSCVNCLLKRYIFVTSIVHSANFGGLDGADHLCNDLAQKNPIIFKRKFRAWLSSSNDDAKDRFQRGLGPYYRLDNVIVVVTGEDFIKGTLIHPIISDEDGFFRSSLVFTNTLPNGTKASSLDCNNWNSNKIYDYTFLGNSDKNDSRWTFDTKQSSCAVSRPIYCVEEVL